MKVAVRDDSPIYVTYHPALQQFRAELTHNSTKFLLSDNSGSMRCSTLTTITSHNRPKSSEFEDEWRIYNFLGRPTNDQSDCFSNFSYKLARGYEIREPAKSQTDHFD